MLHYFPFHASIAAPTPAKPTYHPRRKGNGWPDECPPLRAANAFGWDILAPFTMTFRRAREGWKHVDPVDLESDFAWEPKGAEGTGQPMVQTNAWFWDKGQELPHKISDDVWPELRDQVKVSTYLWMKTDKNELLMLGDVPNRVVPWRAFTAVLDTDWYPASYPWHGVLILDRREKEIRIEKGTPLFRLTVHRRTDYRAKPMTDSGFDAFFSRGQNWLTEHARGVVGDTADIRGAYVKQQKVARFLQGP